MNEDVASKPVDRSSKVLESLRLALIEGEESGQSTPFNFDEFIMRKRAGILTSPQRGEAPR